MGQYLTIVADGSMWGHRHPFAHHRNLPSPWSDAAPEAEIAEFAHINPFVKNAVVNYAVVTNEAIRHNY